MLIFILRNILVLEVFTCVSLVRDSAGLCFIGVLGDCTKVAIGSYDGGVRVEMMFWLGVNSNELGIDMKNFKINDAKPVVKQVEELQIIIHEVELYLKHLTDDMSFEQLFLKIRVEEDNRMKEKADANSIEPNTNMVGESSSKSKSNHKNKGKNGGGSG
ncbi:hypothetical protein Tco_0233308 [Tanacetum coccineum]